MSTEEKKDIPTTTCPECERVWPEISEQSVVQSIVGKCYACLIQEVVAERDKRVEEADYQIENCPECTGQPGKRDKCVTCFGHGWVESKGESLIQLIQ